MYQKSAYPSSVSFSMRFSQFYSQRASYILNCLSSLSIHKSKKPGHPSSFTFAMGFCYFYSQRPSIILNGRPSLPLQISKKPGYPTVVLSVFFTFIRGGQVMYNLVVPSWSTKFIKNSHQNLPV